MTANDHEQLPSPRPRSLPAPPFVRPVRGEVAGRKQPAARRSSLLPPFTGTHGVQSISLTPAVVEALPPEAIEAVRPEVTVSEGDVVNTGAAETVRADEQASRSSEFQSRLELPAAEPIADAAMFGAPQGATAGWAGSGDATTNAAAADARPEAETAAILADDRTVPTSEPASGLESASSMEQWRAREATDSATLSFVPPATELERSTLLNQEALASAAPVEVEPLDESAAADAAFPVNRSEPPTGTSSTAVRTELAVASALERVAQRLRDGELVISTDPTPLADEAALAIALAALLREPRR